MKKKLAIINQRYGMEVNGGSEYYTRLIAEHLKAYYDVQILTTTAQNCDTWENVYPPGNTVVNGVSVKRFSVKYSRDMKRFRWVNRFVRALTALGIHLDHWWVCKQGPVVPELIQYLDENKDQYDAFIFVTYLYYPTVIGLPKIGSETILIPTAHDERYIYYPIYKKIFKECKKIIYLTEEEKQFVQRQFHNQDIPNDVIGVGIEIPEKLQTKEEKEKAVQIFHKKYHIRGNYLIYAGRVDCSKSCDEMFLFFQEYKKLYPKEELSLVVIGKIMMDVPCDPDIHCLGFVPEEDKYAGIAGARFLWLPSRFESLSIALLEGMALGVPGVVNGRCEVLKGHCVRSQGAVCYVDQDDFVQNMHRLQTMTREEYVSMKENAQKYVQEHYCWNTVEEKLRDIIG